MAEQSLIIDFGPYESDDDVFAFQEHLMAAVAASGLGDFDGNELADDNSEGRFYFTSRDVDSLFAALTPLLRVEPAMSGARIYRRYGAFNDPSARATTVIFE